MKQCILILMVTLILPGCAVKSMQFPIEKQGPLAQMAKMGRGDIQIKVVHSTGKTLVNGKAVEGDSRYVAPNQTNLDPSWYHGASHPPRFYTDGDLYQALKDSLKDAVAGAGYNLGDKGPTLEVAILNFGAGLQPKPFTMEELYAQAGNYDKNTRTLYAFRYLGSLRQGIGQPCTVIMTTGTIKGVDGKVMQDAPLIGNRCMGMSFENPDTYSKSMAESIKDWQWESVKFLNTTLTGR
jgi:hypothetical protein